MKRGSTMKYMRIKNIITAAMLAASFALAACGGDGASSQVPEEETLNIAKNDDIVSMDVHKTTNDYLVPMNVFDTLFTVVKGSDGTTSIEKSLVEDYDISVDGLTYNFTLREGVQFSDGTPLLADDVKFTFERMLTLPDSQQTDYAMSIDGAQDLLDGKADSLRGITVEDGTHFTITLSEPFSGFLAQLATPSTSIFSRSIVTAAGDDFGVVPEKTIGTGPYIVTSWDRGSGLTFEYNTRYWGKEPTVKKANVKIMDAASMDMAFQKGDLDIIDCYMLDSAVVENTYKKKYANSIVSVDLFGIYFFMLNENIKPLDDVSVRRAIQMAIDRQAILDSIYGGDGKLEDGIIPTGCLGYSEDNQGWLKHDPDAAKQLLSEAGYANGFDMEIALDSGTADAVKNAVQIVAQDLSDIGINAEIKSYDHASWLDLRNSGEMPAFMGNWALDFNDPDNIIYTFFGNEGNTVIRSNNYPDTDTIDRVAGARAIVDRNERMKEYALLEKKLVQEDAVWVPMYSLKHLYVIGDKVAAFQPQWAGWSDMYFTGVELK